MGGVETSAARQANRSATLARLLSAVPVTTGPVNTGTPVTRAWLAEATGLSPATVSRVADGLIAEGLIAEGAAVTSGLRGRHAVSLRLTGAMGIVCGVDIGGLGCRIILSDLLGRQLAWDSAATPVELGTADLADWLAAWVTRMVAGADRPLRAVAMGLPGMVTADGLRISGAPNVPQIEGTVFARRLSRALPARVTLDNDANLALLGELRFGAGRGLSTVVLLAIGAGLGGGVAVDGRLLRGGSGMVGEFGYLPAGPSGEPAEEFLSGAGLLRRARALGVRLTGAREVFDAAAPGVLDPLREQFDRALLLTLTAASVSCEPQAIIIGGDLAPAIAPRLAAARRRLGELLPVPPELRLAELGDRSGAFGAVVAACQAAYAGLGITEADAAHLPAIGEPRRPDDKPHDEPGKPDDNQRTQNRLAR
jgi:predicted NBD/HSP70 family sugar kinase